METQEITLHESDIKTLKGLAVHAAKALADKATATDEISSITAALEKELRRINQLIGINRHFCLLICGLVGSDEP